MTLYLIPTFHTDPSIETKLPLMLNDLAPDIIFSEASKKLMGEFERAERTMRSIARARFPGSELDALLGEYFSASAREPKISEAYARSHGIPHALIDHPDGMAQMMAGLPAMVDSVRTDSEHRLVSIYLAALGKLSRPPEPGRWQSLLAIEGTSVFEERLDALGAFDIGKRDEYMAKRIRDRYDPKQVAVMPLGEFHALDSYSFRTLYSIISDLSPVRIALQDYPT